MLTDQDIKNIVEANRQVFPTKEDFSRLSIAVADLKVTAEETKADVAGLQQSIHSLSVAVDGLIKVITDLRAEYAAVAAKNTRHEKWILQLAEKVGLKLED